MDLSVNGEMLDISAKVLGEFYGFPITNSMVMAVFDFALIIILTIFVARFRVKNPTKLQLAIEALFEMITDLINQVVGDIKISRQIMPLISSLIVYIMLSNLSAIFFPILTGFTYDGHALFRSHTDDFNTTLSLAVGMIFLVQMYSIRKLNPLGYILQFIQVDKVVVGFSKGIGTGFIAIINAFVGLLNLLSEFSKVLSLSLRLFGNMFAGELLAAVLMSIFAIGLPVPIAMLSLLSGTIQAIVFGSLSASFLKEALVEENSNIN